MNDFSHFDFRTVSFQTNTRASNFSTEECKMWLLVLNPRRCQTAAPTHVLLNQSTTANQSFRFGKGPTTSANNLHSRGWDRKMKQIMKYKYGIILHNIDIDHPLPTAWPSARKKSWHCRSSGTTGGGGGALLPSMFLRITNYL